MAVSKTACKALESMHKRALFANLLVDSESEALKKYFDGETPYTDKVGRNECFHSTFRN